MQKRLNFVVFVPTEEEARQKAKKWFTNLSNLSVDKIIPYSKGGFQVWISYDECEPE